MTRDPGFSTLPMVSPPSYAVCEAMTAASLIGSILGIAVFTYIMRVAV